MKPDRQPTYVSIDLDYPTRLEIVKSWYTVEMYRPEGYEGPFGRLSASKVGVHVRNRQILPADVPVAEEPRRIAGDDMERLREDIDNPCAPNQLLFDKKGGKRAGPWTDSLETLCRRYRRQHDLPPWYEKGGGAHP